MPAIMTMAAGIKLEKNLLFSKIRLNKMKKIILSITFLLAGIISLPSLIEAQQLDVPHITNFQQISPQDGTFSFSATYPKDALSAAQEYNTKGNSDNPIRIVAEIKIDDYEWQSCRVHSADILEENKTFDSEIARKLQSEGTVQLRIKIIDNKEQFPETDWSNILAINATGPEDDGEEYSENGESAEESATGEDSGKKAKKVSKDKRTANSSKKSAQSCLLNNENCCKQIFGLSICIWQGIAALIFIILLIVYRKIAMFALLIVILAVSFILLRNGGKLENKKNAVPAEQTTVQTENNAVNQQAGNN